MKRTSCRTRYLSLWPFWAGAAITRAICSIQTQKRKYSVPATQSTVVANSRYSRFSIDLYILPHHPLPPNCSITLQPSSVSQRLLRTTCRTIAYLLNCRLLGPISCPKERVLEICNLKEYPPPDNLDALWYLRSCATLDHASETFTCIGGTWQLVKM